MGIFAENMKMFVEVITDLKGNIFTIYRIYLK